MQNKKKQLWMAALLLAAAFLASPIKAQVTIGSLTQPDVNSLLDLKQAGTTTKGVLPPRVALSSTTSNSPMTAPIANGMTVYNTVTAGDVTPGYYYWDASLPTPKWIRVGNGGTAAPQFFYMPSIVLPLDNSDPTLYDGFDGTTFTIKLYDRFKAQFGMTAANVTKSASAINPLPVYSAAELEYFITYYDASVFATVNVSDAGVLTYTLKPSPLPLSDKTFMNIVFEVKPKS